jgi:DNA-binding beta-propeller fold protein YncE
MTRICIRVLPVVIGLVFLGFGVAAEPPESDYKVLKKIKIGGEGRWDYLTMDSDSGRLYISRSTRVQVVDIENEKLVGEVPNTKGIHGIALAPRHKKGFTSNGQDSSVTIFDLGTLKETGRVTVGKGPDAIIYDPATDRVFTFNAGSQDATAISAESGEVAGTVKLEGRPEFAAANEKGMVYVAIVSKSEVVAFDAKTLEVKNRWSLDPGKGPHGLAMDKTKRRLFVTCSNEKMIVMSADSGKILETLTIGKGTDAAGYDPGTNLAFSSNGDGTLTIVEEKPADHYQVQANVPTQAGARTMAVDTKKHQVLLVTASFKKADPNQKQKGRPGFEPDSFVVLVVGK